MGIAVSHSIEATLRVASAFKNDSQQKGNTMLYTIIGQDVADSLAKRLAARPAHLARLHALQASGRLILAGPFPSVDAMDPGAAGFTGSLIVAEFANLAAAQQWADEDPYVAAGVYREVSVYPFKQVFPQ